MQHVSCCGVGGWVGEVLGLVFQQLPKHVGDAVAAGGVVLTGGNACFAGQQQLFVVDTRGEGGGGGKTDGQYYASTGGLESLQLALQCCSLPLADCATTLRHYLACWLSGCPHGALCSSATCV